MPQAAVPLAAEAAVATTMTAAEIAAAEAAAAAAAEAATVAATEQAAAQAAAQVAAEQAATQTATQTAAQAAAEQAAQQATTGGISDLTVNLNGNPTLAEMLKTVPEGTVSSLATTAPVTPSAPVQTAPISGTPPAAPPPVAPPPPAPPPPEALSRSLGPIDTTARMATSGFDTAGFENMDGITTLAREVGAQPPAMPGVQTAMSGYGAGAPVSSALPPALPGLVAGPPAAPGLTGLQTNLASAGANLPPPAPTMAPPPTQEMFPNVQAGSAINTPYQSWSPPMEPTAMTGTQTLPPAEPNVLQGLYNDFKAMPLKDKALTGMMASSAYQMLNQPKPYEKPKYKSTFNSRAYSGYTPTPPTPYQPQYAHGGLADLGGYSDGGRMLKGPGDGMSDDIPATIANKQPARLANEEFVIPADVVSHLGNGSSEAGAKQLYKMMDRVRQARTGTKKQGKQIKPEKYLA